jgi:hypothetical protein
MQLQYTFTMKIFLPGLLHRGGKSPLQLPCVEGCTVFLGVKSSWGINMAENKKPLNQEDNQASQPTISHLETDLNNSTAIVSIGL